MSAVDPVLAIDGWLAVPGVLTPAQSAAVAEHCAAVLAGYPVPGDKRAGGSRRAGSLLTRLPEIAGIVEHPAVAAAVASLLGRQLPVGEVAFRCPQPGFGRQSLHCDDTPITSAGVCRAVTAIVALCDFTAANGPTAVVPGSHRRPDLQRQPERHDLGRAEVLLPGLAGTAFVFSAYLLHRGTRNRSDRPRPALQAQWRLADQTASS